MKRGGGGLPDEPRCQVAVLISGGGTTLQNLLDCHQMGTLPVDFPLVISSNSDARGLQFAQQAGISTQVFPRQQSATARAYGEAIFRACRQVSADLVVMAGFLKRVSIPDDFAGRVMNIHPSLIPAFCGRGFYGARVHQAVLDYGAKISGCTVHFVDNQYDHGPIILQRAVPVLDDDTPQSLADRVFAQECQAYPEAIRLFVAGRLQLHGRLVRVLPAG